MPDMFFGHVGRVRSGEKSGKDDLWLQYRYSQRRARSTTCRPRCASRSSGWSRRCSSAAAASASAPPLPPEAAEEGDQELARAQHRWVLEAVREGFVDDVLNQETVEEAGGAVSGLAAGLGGGSDSSLPGSLGWICCRHRQRWRASWKIESASGVLRHAYQ